MMPVILQVRFMVQQVEADSLKTMCPHENLKQPDAYEYSTSLKAVS